MHFARLVSWMMCLYHIYTAFLQWTDPKRNHWSSDQPIISDVKSFLNNERSHKRTWFDPQTKWLGGVNPLQKRSIRT